MDINTQFISNHAAFYVEARLASAGQYRYGNATPLATMIAAVAAGIRRASGTIERWARGANAEVVEHRLPRLNSAR